MRFALFAMAGLLSLATVATAENLKIGAVSITKILNDAPQAEAANKRLQQEFGPREKSLLDAQKSLRNLEQKLAKDGAVMSETQRRNMERDVRTQARELQRASEEFRDDVNLRRNEELGKFQVQIREIIDKLAKEQGFDLILNEGGVIFASEKVDITEQVLKRLSGR